MLLESTIIISLLSSAIAIFLVFAYFLQKKELNILKKEQLEQKEENTILKEINLNMERENASLSSKLEMLENNKDEMKKEFKVLASEIFEDNSKKFSEQNSQNLSLTLEPMKEQIKDFKKKIEDVYINEAKERSVLGAQISTLKELNLQISQDAINLTNALKGGVKNQGIWGEMVLSKVLESSGLRLNEEYFTEVVLNSNDDTKFRPDVIVNLPNERNVIIDAKTSLNAYDRYVSSDENQDKQIYLKEHIIALKNHIKSLSNKEYEKLQGVNSLDFIFMFVPIEAALILALQNDTTLYDEAFKKKIVLVSPTTLLVALKAIENSWRYEKQAKNITAMVSRAEVIYNKLYNFIEDLKDVGDSLQNADRKYNDAFKKLSDGKGNILRQIEMFKDEANINPKNRIDI